MGGEGTAHAISPRYTLIQMPTDALLPLLAANQPRLLARLRQLVEIESPTEDKPGVDRAGELVASWATELGATVRRHRRQATGDVLELRFGKTKRARGRVLLLGHLDTVWPLGTLAHMPWRETKATHSKVTRNEPARLYGPGILDMKAGVVMAIEALAALHTLGLTRPATLLLNPDEETGSAASRALTEQLAQQCSAVFVLEPAQGLAYKTARKGVGHYTLTVTGVASHAGVDFERGHSAIHELARQVERISSLTDLARGLTVNVGVIQGGTRSNVVAASASAEIDVRIAHAADANRIERQLRALRPIDKACTLTLTGGINRPPMERKSGTVALFRTAQRLARQLGLALTEAATGGGSDGNFTAALGIPTLDGMGAVGAGAHASHEHIEHSHLLERTTLLAAMLATVD
jgi:glutamate carboxypeptidase